MSSCKRLRVGSPPVHRWEGLENFHRRNWNVSKCHTVLRLLWIRPCIFVSNRSWRIFYAMKDCQFSTKYINYINADYFLKHRQLFCLCRGQGPWFLRGRDLTLYLILQPVFNTFRKSKIHPKCTNHFSSAYFIYFPLPRLDSLSSDLPIPQFACVRKISGYYLKTFKAVNVSLPHIKYVFQHLPLSPSFILPFVPI